MSKMRARMAAGLAEELREGGLHAHQLANGGNFRIRWVLISPERKTLKCGTESCFKMRFKSVEGATNRAD